MREAVVMADRPRVLLVDDTDLASIRMMIDDREFDVVGTATNGQAALDVAKATEFDVAIVDYRMEGMDGVETAERLKGLRPGAKVIILTSYDVRDVVGQSPHVDHYHEKIAAESLPEAIVQLFSPTESPKPGRERSRFGRRR